MRFVHSFALVLVASCGATSKMSPGGTPYYAPTSVAATPSDAIATDAPTTGDTHVHYGVNPWTETSRDPLSTFAADVDTASYTFARRVLNEGGLPPAAAIRVEEFVNAFDYAFPAPRAGSPFSVIMDAAPSPLDAKHHIVRAGVATPDKSNEDRKPTNLVFLVDVSGSMAPQDRLPLAKQSLHWLTDSLRPTDTVSLVTYAGSTEVVLPMTSAEDKARIRRAIDSLGAGGSTAMGSGLQLAYEQAAKGLRPGAISRVIVLSDGDANVGPASHDQLLRAIEDRVKQGVTLSTIGFGMGNYRADLMEQLGNKGNGNNYYVDSAAAAKKLFTRDLVAMLEVAAKDAKLQVEFDPERVARYRLIGYENRAIADKDFRKDDVDAGEIGAGHQVTALYEVQLTEAAAADPAPLGRVRIRHKHPEGDTATEAVFEMERAPAATFDDAGSDFRFAVAVAAFADILRGAEEAQAWSLAHIGQVARATAGSDSDRLELVQLIERARSLRPATAAVAR